MPQFTPTVQVPYRYIQDLPKTAQNQLFRNFEELARNISTTATSAYDAIIDASLSVSIPSQHRYKNLTDLVASEGVNAGISAPPFQIWVVANGHTVTETANVSMFQPVHIDGRGAVSVPFAGSRPAWDCQGHTVTNTAPTTVSNIHFFSNITGFPGPTAMFVGDLYLDSCQADSFSGIGGQMGAPCTGVLYAYNTLFSGCVFNSTAVLLDCHYDTQKTTNFTLTSSDLFWLGGTFNVNSAAAGVTISLNGASRFIYIVGITPANTDISGSTTGSVATIVVNNTGGNRIDFSGAVVNVTVAAAAGPTVVLGFYSAATFQVNTNNRLRAFDGALNGIGDFTGPMSAHVILAPGGSTIFRGSGVRADVGGVTTTNTGTPAVALTACLDSNISAAFGPNAIGKPYAIDAASARCVLIFGGAGGAWATGGTNASGTCNIVTEAGMIGGGTVDVTAIHRDGLWFTPTLMLGGM